MYKIRDYYNNSNLFRVGFLIGTGLAFIISGSIIIILGFNNMIK